MSWYSGSHESITSPRGSTAARMQASMLADSTRSGIITPFGSLVDPLVYCRITSRSGSCGGDLEGVSRRAARSAGQHAAPAERSAGRPAPPRRTRRAASSISTSLASPWRMRPRVRLDELLERSHPHRQREHHRGDAGHPASADGRHQIHGWSVRARRRGRRGPDPSPAARRRRRAPRRGSAARARTRAVGPATEAPTKRTPVPESAAVRAVRRWTRPMARTSCSRRYPSAWSVPRIAARLTTPNRESYCAPGRRLPGGIQPAPPTSSPVGAFRPFTPQMNLRTFSFKNSQATHVRIRVLHSRVHGRPAVRRRAG